ncbi:hypothetical protein [Caballeronia cordobensis]|uniref:hypothetical protein n=1 Tax=Caballeronia cordobensis TaxID=1353886 RepID=UPI0006AD7EE6|nr:hypothetical protein [Caballeronia cordobensis]
MCAEPSPDVAKALSDAITASTNATANGLKVLGGTGAEASLDAFLSTARGGSIGELGRRLPTTQLLRDGVYRLCEAYANGAITREEYALVLSRYGETMVTLLAIESLTGMSKDLKPMNITAQATPPAVPQQQPAKPNADVNKNGNQAAIDDAAPTVTRGVPPLPDTMSDAVLQKISLTMPRAMVKTAGGDPANPPIQPAPRAEGANGASGDTTTGANTDLSKVADTVLRLQENYLKHSATAPLIVLCSEAIGPRMLGGETLKANCEKILGIWVNAEAAKLPALQTPTIGADANPAIAPRRKPERGK